MWWMVALAPLLLILIVVWIPVQLSASASVDDTKIVLQAGVRWAFWQLWRWPVALAADGGSQEATLEPQPAVRTKQTPAATRAGRAKRSGRHLPSLDFTELWPLLKKYWRQTLGLLLHSVVGDLRLELADAALTGWLFAAAGATGWPPTSLRLQLSFGQTNRLVGELRMLVRIYPAEVIGLMLRLACEPPIRRRILQRIRGTSR